MKIVSAVALALIIIGGLNWGLVGFFEYNFVDGLLGEGSVVSRVVYGLVGVAALWKLAVVVYRLTANSK